MAVVKYEGGVLSLLIKAIADNYTALEAKFLQIASAIKDRLKSDASLEQAIAEAKKLLDGIKVELASAGRACNADPQCEASKLELQRMTDKYHRCKERLKELENELLRRKTRGL
eukprot:TRINITY_DN5361_c0_g1_i1.p1 TRINITY_DN5361_c0_g1~~TRINITY_DN5361_c0_g1_i1.p1  ORF type:complete len:114 (-),score=22.31 TRINITY_DN5361_c0_g1_i1:47-388(-)